MRAMSQIPGSALYNISAADRAEPAMYWIRGRLTYPALSCVMLLWLAWTDTAILERFFSDMTHRQENAQRASIGLDLARSELLGAAHSDYVTAELAVSMVA